ncbi:helix-turn-helix transcriptional regulator [Zafaria cholistanensis]|uniref:Helix-turn-helix transcriptional regulator n=1 Tax=Zafaria cholistanensis TaxID=1682741 RepID=A0A5A7NS44_9MICC|nr:LuxR C-terminal-related transcriptional regulator [Zafaria cholistanensis]GER22932.1 helix-turn-helix transcriptional regulator [Zafaria cholistanensis]
MRDQAAADQAMADRAMTDWTTALPVLATKLFVPSPRAGAVPRPRLVNQLASGRQAGRRLTLVSAPAGFGKTALLSEWIAQTRRRHPEVRVAWLSLDESDNDPVRFLTYLAAALHRADAAIGREDPEVRLPVEATLTSLINDMARSAQPLILFLDDFQRIEDLTVVEAVVSLLDHLPSTAHVAIASRSDPLLPLARLRAGADLTELRAADLRFTPDEASAFLNEVMGLSLSRQDEAVLGTRTEGWIAGLQLAGLSLRESPDVSAFIEAFAGSNRFVIDYLVEEVLNRAAPDIRDFLYRTAILDRLSGPLCDAVAGRTDSTRMLESIERANLFIVPLDDSRQWYRYHHLFADVLRSRVLARGPAHVAALHRLASEWYEHNGSPDEAIRHAFEAADFPRAARMIEAIIPGVRKSRQDATLLGWLAALPDDTRKRRPVLQVFSAWASLVAGDLSTASLQLDEAEHLLAAGTAGGPPAHDSGPSQELHTLPVTIELYRASLALASGNRPGTAHHAQRALRLAEPDDHLGRGAAAGLLGLAAWATGELDAGVAAFRDSAKSLRSAGNLTDALSTTMVIADMLLPLGRLREAQRMYETALRQSLEYGNSGQPRADLHAGLAAVLRESNEIALARNHLSASAELGESALSHEHRYRWFVAMAGVHEAEGETDLALKFLTDAEQHYRRGFFPDVCPIGGLKARIYIRQGRLPEARAWVDGQGLTPTDTPDYLHEFGHITLARLMIAEHNAGLPGQPLDDARGLLGRLLAAAEAGRRLGSVSEILMLQALADHAQGKTAHALVPLERALSWAESEGCFRLFIDEGAPMLALLRTAAGAGISPDFVRRLSQALRNTSGPLAPSQLREMLSERELHVLRLLATELSGPEIARELRISLNTLRTHTKHIFRKLEVSSRASALHRAETLGLI